MDKVKIDKQPKQNLTANENGSEKVEADMSKIPFRAGSDSVLGKKDTSAA